MLQGMVKQTLNPKLVCFGQLRPSETLQLRFKESKDWPSKFRLRV